MLRAPCRWWRDLRLPQARTPYVVRMTDLFRDNLQAALGASFTLDRELGGGGMSRVFLARDVALDRDVVVKVLSPELAQVLSVERFGREIALAAALQHANIVPVLSAGTTQDKLPYYLMPFIEGSSLRDLVAGQTQLPIADVLLVLNDVTRALIYAHGRGVVHRDIKPDNVMLSGGAALVTDFGIAKAMSSARAEPVNDSLTRVGTSLGSPAYMSPEQGAGDPDTDHRTDLYALGAMAYELLIGRPPFGDRPAHAQLIAHVIETPVPVMTLRPDVPEPLAHLVMQCLAKEPSERPQLATEVLARLADAALAARAGTTGQHPAPDSLHEALGRPVGGRILSRRGVRLVIAAGLLTVAPGVAWLVTDRMRAPVGPDATLVAVMPFTVRDAALGVWREGMVDVLARSLDGAGTLRTVSPSTSIAQSGARADVTTATALGIRVGAGLVIFGELSPVGRDSVRARVALVDVKRAAVQHEVDVSGEVTRIDALADSVAIQLVRALGSSGALASGARVTSIGTSSLPALKAYLHGLQFYRRGNIDSARVAFDAAVTIDSLFALGWRGVASIYIRTGREAMPEAQAALDRAIRLRRGGSPRDSLLLHGDSLRLAVVRRTPTTTDALDEIPALTALFATLTEATRRYPGDAELWLELGDAGYHFGEFAGRGDTLVLRDFRQAIALDSMLLVPYVHATSLALRTAHFSEAAGYARQMVRLSPELAPYYRVLATVLDSAPRFSAAARAALDTLPARYVAAMMQAIGVVPEATALSQLLAVSQLERLTRVPTLADSAAFGRLLLLLQAQGGTVSSAKSPLVLGDRTQLALAGLLPTQPVLAEVAEVLARQPAAAGSAMPLLSTARDTAALKILVRVLDSVDVAVRAQTPRAVSERGRAARGYLALARGDSAEALRELLSLPMAMCEGAPCAVLTTVRLLVRAGRDADAARFLDRALPSNMSSAVTPPLMLLRAEVAERLTDRATARRWYQRVVAQWGKGAVTVQPVVQAARAGLSRVQ